MPFLITVADTLSYGCKFLILIHNRKQVFLKNVQLFNCLILIFDKRTAHGPRLDISRLVALTTDQVFIFYV